MGKCNTFDHSIDSKGSDNAAAVQYHSQTQASLNQPNWMINNECLNEDLSGDKLVRGKLCLRLLLLNLDRASCC
jgi:hypothetical protein